MSASIKPIKLYSHGTPNGQKVHIGLEELGLPYEAIPCNPFQPGSGIEKLNLNQKIPTIVDPNLKGADGSDLGVFESGAILLHLAENYGNGKLLPTDPAKKSVTIQWLFWQMAGIGPMFGQFFHFTKYAPEQIEYAKTRYTNEVKRLLKVLDQQLGLTKKYIAGDEYSIADVATWPWINGFRNWVKDVIDWQQYPNVIRWHEEIAKRPAVVKGLTVLPM